MSDQRDERFPAETEQMLRVAGWKPGRDVSRDVRLPRGFTPFPAALRALAEFGGLRIGQSGAGIAFARTPLILDPMRLVGEDDRFGELEPLVGGALYPLGEVEDGQGFIAIDERGRVFFIFEDIWFVDDTIDGALDTLLRGAKPLRLIDESGHW